MADTAQAEVLRTTTGHNGTTLDAFSATDWALLAGIVAIALGAIVRDETIAIVSMIGTAMVIAGAWLASRRENA